MELRYHFDALSTFIGGFVMDRAEAESGVLAVIREHFAVKEGKVITLETTFEDLGADSLDVVELELDLEEELNVTIPSGASTNFSKIGDVVDLLVKLPTSA